MYQQIRHWKNTSSSFSHADIVCHTYPGESVVIHLIFSGDELERGITPNLKSFVSSKKVRPLPYKSLDPSVRIDPSITIAYFLVKNMSWTKAAIGVSNGMWKYWLGVPFLNKDLQKAPGLQHDVREYTLNSLYPILSTNNINMF